LTEEFISIGKIVSTHGLKGKVKVITDGSILSEHGNGLEIFLSPDSKSPTFKIISVSRQKSLVISIKDVETIEAANPLVGKNIYIQKSNVPGLPVGEYYNFQILGLKPVESGIPIAGFTVCSVMENAVHPILEFSNGETSVLIPFIDKYIGAISLQAGEVEVKDWQAWIDAL